MKIKTLLFLWFSILLFSCEKEVEIKFTNTHSFERNDETIVLSREEITDKLALQEGMLPVFETGDDHKVPSQLDDLDGDGEWDEAIINLDFKAGETIEVEIKPVPEAEYPELEKRTNLRLAIKQEDGSYKEVDTYAALPCKDGFKVIAQAESVNWENDKIAFRKYLRTLVSFSWCASSH